MGNMSEVMDRSAVSMPLFLAKRDLFQARYLPEGSCQPVGAVFDCSHVVRGNPREVTNYRLQVLKWTTKPDGTMPVDLNAMRAKKP
ncbi:MAG: hypothetical protein ACTSU9_03490 [Promethearchaeota archaeon]